MFSYGPRARRLPDSDDQSAARRCKRPAGTFLAPSFSATRGWFRFCVGWFVVVGLAGAPSRAADVQRLQQQALRAAVDAVAPAVVRIELLGGVEAGGSVSAAAGPTTGLVVAEDGLIVSSAFYFVQRPASILVTLPDGKRIAASIVARDRSRNLVLLKVATGEKLSVPPAVPRDEIAVGQWAVAVGRTLSAEGPNVSVGIISATHRIWGKAIQTDAKVSPSNYGGPLVDLRGRVYGILAPLSPQGRDASAGAEWYDSGIGFAIPLADFNEQLPALRQGKDRYAGILGVSLKNTDLYGQPVIIGACLPNSPAAKAGLKTDDQIVEFNGRKIARGVQLRHALGPLYAGQTVHVGLLRDGKRLDVTAELTDKIQPYERAFLGILPRRDTVAAQAGPIVRYVYPGSPADDAAVQAGDRLVRVQGEPVADARACRDRLAQLQPGDPLPVTLARGQQTVERTVKLGHLPADVPARLPPAHQPIETATAADRPPVGVVDIRLPEEPNRCFAFVPDRYDPSVPHGVVVWLDVPGNVKRQPLIDRWKGLCAERDLILLAPSSTDDKRWQPTEIDVIQKMLDELARRYELDRTRVVVCGYQAGGAMAYRVVFAHRQTFRAVVAVDAPLPMPPPPNDPMFPLAIFTTTAKQSKLAEPITASIQRLREMKYPVTVRPQGPTARHFSPDELAELARWIDTLDRI